MVPECDHPPQNEDMMQDAAVSSDKLLLTTNEVARLLSMSRTIVYRLIMRKALFSVKIGGARRIPIYAVHAFVDELTAAEK